MTLRETFDSLYPHLADVRTRFCPYRLCPLGAHSDHQFGCVTGFAIDQGVTIVYSPTDNGVVEVSSLNFEGKKQFHLMDIPAHSSDWASYLRGAAKALSSRFPVRRGLYGVIEGSLPVGGLSSSAAVILAFLAALCDANDLQPSRSEMIEMALWAENHYVGVNVGKLDQSCEVYCKKDHLLFLDTLDDSYELIPSAPDMPAYEFAIFFSGIQRTLVGSAFNMRVDELKAASYALKSFAGMPYGKFADSRLREVPRDIYEQYKDRLPENWRRRAAHFYTEFDRVHLGAEAWRKGDLITFGQLIFESGRSSIEQYETGSEELKALYEIMLRTDGIYGGRFSGAGFKGCCMAIIDPACREQIAQKVMSEYIRRFPHLEGQASAHFVHSADGCSMG